MAAARLIFIVILLLIGKDSIALTLYDFIMLENQSGEIPDDSGDKISEADIDFLPPIKDKGLFESVNDLSICRDKLVRTYIFQYITQARKFLVNAITRSDRYLSIIGEVFEDNGDIPKDISLLPMLESGFNPYAVSRSKAVGLWQLLGSTSRDLGLKVNKWVDERRDIEKSTDAAIRHLRNLYNIFQSWELALAAYNGGANHVRRAMIKTKSKTFEQLLESESLKRETSEFVHRFAALLVIYKNQDLFNIESDIPEADIFETENILLKYPVRIHEISKSAGISLAILKIYNPELKRSITPPYEKDYTLRIPAGSKGKIEEKISKLYVVKFKDIRKHIVRKGECISKIAEQYNIKMDRIIELNNIKNPHLIRPGLELYIPI